MKNFKEIAEKCLAGKLSGTFIFNNGENIHSTFLVRYNIGKVIIPDYYLIFNNLVSRDGNNHFCNNNVINFIPDMQKQITIDVPEDKVPVVEQTEKGVVITWKEKELSYDDIANHIWEQGTQIGVLTSTIVNENTNKFSKKVEVLRKLTMIRNYFGKPEDMLEGWCITYSKHYNTFTVNYINDADMWFRGVIFKEGEHAEQAIKMLGDELKYLFEPW